MENIIINAECMRDFAGSFYQIRNNDRRNMLIYLIPNATKRAIHNDPEWFGCDTQQGIDEMRKDMVRVCNEILRDGFDFMLNDYEPTKQVLSDWVRGVRSVSDFTESEINAIVDGYYIHSVSSVVERVALSLMKGHMSPSLKEVAL